MKEYKTVTQIAGPLVFVENVSGVGYNEIVEITLPDGEKKKGQVLEISENVAAESRMDEIVGIVKEIDEEFNRAIKKAG
ncbi:MAG: V-type ATP synthase subunit B, partial [Candidatus Micrarchaeia archaeon]